MAPVGKKGAGLSPGIIHDWMPGAKPAWFAGRRSALLLVFLSKAEAKASFAFAVAAFAVTGALSAGGSGGLVGAGELSAAEAQRLFDSDEAIVVAVPELEIVHRH